MSEDENFLARWSSRKLASRTPAAASEAPQRPREDGVENAAVAAPAKDAATPAPTPPDQSFHPARLTTAMTQRSKMRPANRLRADDQRSRTAASRAHSCLRSHFGDTARANPSAFWGLHSLKLLTPALAQR